jgi:hypothetical protein
MKRPATKKNGDPQPCNRQYRIKSSDGWRRLRHCQKPEGHAGRCGSQTIK